MEANWLAIMISILFMGAFTALSVETYYRNQCKIAYAQSGKSADEIVKICQK